MKSVSDLWKPSKLIFIILNVTISCLGFIRSVIFLDYMTFYQLGLVSVFQTLILLISLSQLGILNGAYRAYSGNKNYYRKVINNFTFSYFLLLSAVVVIVLSAYFAFNFSTEASILLLGGIAGIFSLMTNYLNNCLLSDSKIRLVNIINIISNLIGFSSLGLIIYNPLLGLLSFLIQPFTFIFLCFLFERSLIPRRVFFSINIFRFLLRLGFIPYLTGLFVYMNLQLERWTIVYFLGIETFGRYYLAVAFTSLFALFPNSINSLYFPRMVRAYSGSQVAEFLTLFRRYGYILSLYCIMAAVVTLTIAPEVIERYFPHHSDNVKYIFLILPGLMAVTLINPHVVFFNASLNLRPLLSAYGSSSIVITLIILTLFITGNISLGNIALTDTIGNIAICVLTFISFLKNRKDVLKTDRS